MPNVEYVQWLAYFDWLAWREDQEANKAETAAAVKGKR